jgi:hypothetical protein
LKLFVRNGRHRALSVDNDGKRVQAAQGLHVTTITLQLGQPLRGAGNVGNTVYDTVNRHGRGEDLHIHLDLALLGKSFQSITAESFIHLR